MTSHGWRGYALSPVHKTDYIISQKLQRKGQSATTANASRHVYVMAVCVGGREEKTFFGVQLSMCGSFPCSAVGRCPIMKITICQGQSQPHDCGTCETLQTFSRKCVSRTVTFVLACELRATQPFQGVHYLSFLVCTCEECSDLCLLRCT